MTSPRPFTIAEIYDQPAMVPLWPGVGRALGLAESTTYQLAAQHRLPVEVVRLGRRQFVRRVDLLTFLHLPTTSDAAEGATSTASEHNTTEESAQ
ncbi:DNA-binding protein [Streptomyces sp. NPDC093109]|uniref:DNA-binding protein n=1 Tax=Streptomyces sp. NPDC093109 TaxID=3154977 RepID=UPI0034504026